MLLRAVVLCLVSAAALAGPPSPPAGAKPAAPKNIVPVLVIHGGAGVIKKDLSPERRAAVEADLKRALDTGYTVLREGGTSLDAVSQAIVVLEDSPLFNAGKGAVFNHDGKNELDAAIMDGATLRAGSIAGVHRVKNPVLLARAVMERSKHVMLVGDGAEAFAQSVGVELVDPSYFRTEERWNQLQDALKAETAPTPPASAPHHGTVGAVALDKDGHLAAATSTGGMTNKRWGRIGDSPVIGAGTYADAHCAVSATGWGEFYLRTVAAHSICMRLEWKKEKLDVAARAVVLADVPKLGGDGGVIALDADGNVALPFNTDGMYRGWVDKAGKVHVAILPDEH